MAELCFNSFNRSAFILGDEDSDLPGQIAAAAAAGFRLFGPDLYSLRQYRERGGRLEELAEALAAHGMRCFEMPALDISSDLAATLEAAEEMAAMAAVLRPDYVQCNVSSEPGEDTLEAFRRAADRLREEGAGLALEYLPWLPVSNIRSTLELLERGGAEGAGAIVDSWHFFNSDDDWSDLEALPLERLAYVQFDDHPQWVGDDIVHETLQRRVLPGEGVFELERFCRVLRGKGFDGAVSCEILSEEMRSMDLGEFARRVYRSSVRFWS